MQGQSKQNECLCWGQNRDLSTCNCQDGYCDSTLSFKKDCIQCDSTCKTCETTTDNCLSCYTNQFREHDIDSCICINRYFEDGNDICGKCSYKCFRCNLTASNCLDCLEDTFRDFDSNQCICQDGYYDDGSSDACQKCSGKCVTCIDLATKCTSCDNLLLRHLGSVATGDNNQCTCDDGYYDNAVDLLCQECHYSCLKCVNTLDYCTDCLLTGTNRQVGVNSCPCIDRYYDDGQNVTCLNCSTYCYNCINEPDYCISCHAPDFREHDPDDSSKCICQQGYFDNGINVTCQQCHYSCKNCEIVATNCIDCYDGRIHDTTFCICPNGKYDDVFNQLCIPCSATCGKCIESLDKCTECPKGSNRQFNGTLNICTCPGDYFDDGTRDCKQCHSSCKTCSGPDSNNCLSCDLQFRIDKISSTNSCVCSDGFFDNGKIQQCSSINKLFQSLFIECGLSCLTCEQESTRCTSCRDTINYFHEPLTNNTCPCIIGYYESYSSEACRSINNILTKIQECDPQCKTCETYFSKCTACPDNSFRNLIDNQCICQDGYLEIGSIICQKCDYKCLTCQYQYFTCLTCASETRESNFCECKEGFTEIGDKDCLKCNKRCKLCHLQDTNICVTCNDNRSNPPVCECQNHYFEDENQQCIQCAFQCASCKSSQENCIKCKGDRIRLPKCECGEGYYDDFKSNQCQKCDESCKTCDQLQCFTCMANRVVANGKCECEADAIDHENSQYCSTCDTAVVKSQINQDLTIITLKFPYIVKGKNILSFERKNQYCKTLISNYQSLGDNPICELSDDMIIIELGYNNEVFDNHELKLNKKILFRCKEDIQLFIISPIKLPQSTNPPSLELPQFLSGISLCQDIVLGFSNIQNDGKKPFKKIEWLLQQAHPQDINVLSTLTQTIQEANKIESNQLIIPKLSLSEFGTYSIQVEFTNFLDLQGSAFTQFTTSSKESPIAQIDKSNKYKFYPWQPIQITGNFLHVSCESNENIQILKSLKLEWSEVSHEPTESNTLLKSSIKFETNGQEQSNTLRIPSHQASINTTYLIQFKVQLSNKPIENFVQTQIYIQDSPLEIFIVGGSRMQNFKGRLELLGKTKDPNLIMDYNEDKEIKIEWSCNELASNQKCKSSIQEDLKLNKTNFEQNFKSKELMPYNSYLFNLKAVKDYKIQEVSVLIIVIEMDIPILKTHIPNGFLSRKVNLNEQITVELEPESQLTYDDLRFSCQMEYDFEKVSVFRFEYIKTKIIIWNHFNELENSQEFSINFFSKDPYFFMPSISSIKLQLNFPPSLGFIRVTPENGVGIFTLFLIELPGWKDEDLPLTYQYGYYDDLDLYNQDKIVGEDIHKIVLSTPILDSKFQTIFPSPKNDKLLVFVSIIDDLGGITNATQIISVENLSKQLSTTLPLPKLILNLNQYLELKNKIPSLTLMSQVIIASQELSKIIMVVDENDKLLSLVKKLFDYLIYYDQINSNLLLKESLTKSIASMLGTGVIFNKDNMNLIVSSVYNLESMIQFYYKYQAQIEQLASQLKNAQEEQDQSQGMNINQQSQLDTIKNILLCQTGIIASLQSYIDNSEVKQSNDRPILKSILLKASEQISSIVISNQFPNSKPIYYHTKNMSLSSYKISPKKASAIFNQQKKQQGLFMKPNINEVQEIEQISNDDINEAEQQEQEEPEQNGRMLNEQDVPEYEIKVQKYENNPYKNNEDFKFDNITSEVINPQIAIKTKNNKENVTELHNSSIKLEFKDQNQSKKKNQDIPVCLTKSMDDWGTGGCTLQKSINPITAELIYNCDCSLISSTMILKTAQIFLDKTNIKKILDKNQMEIVTQSQFWSFGIVYVLLSITLITIILCIYSSGLDRKEFFQQISKEIDDLPADFPEKNLLVEQLEIQQFQEMKNENSLSQNNNQVRLKNPQDYITFFNNQSKSQSQQQLQINIRQIAAASLKNEIVLVDNDQNKIIKNSGFVTSQDYIEQKMKDTRLKQIKQNKKLLTSKNVKASFNQHLTTGAQKFQIQTKLRKRKQKQDNTNSLHKNKIKYFYIPLSCTLIWTGIKNLHQIGRILTNYNPDIGRPQRFAILYSKLVLMLALQSLFITEMSFIMNVIAASFVGQLTGFVNKQVEKCMKRSRLIKQIGIVFNFFIIFASFLIFITSLSTMKYDDAQNWMYQFLVTFFNEQLITECLKGAFMVGCYQKVVTVMQQDKHNSIAHFIYFFIQSEELEKLVRIEDKSAQYQSEEE